MAGRNENDASVFTSTQPTIKVSKWVQPESEWEYSFGRFKENESYLQEKLEYSRDGSEPGLVLIFNQETFENGSSNRDGSFKDVEDIVTCLSRLGFNMNPDYIFTDLTKEEIFENIDKILANGVKEVNSVMVFFLTHGGPSNSLQSSNAWFLADEMWLKFVECADLYGKPKMFIIQACKGNENTTFSAKPQDTLLVPLSTFSCKRIYPDMLIVYSTMEGKYAFRHNTNGTWLIQELCKNFTAYGRRDDVLTLLSRVIKCICKNYFDEKNNEVIKQIPVVVSTLSKKFYLNKNKDRHFILNLLEKQNEIYEVAKSISEKVSSIHGSEHERKNEKKQCKSPLKSK